MIPVLLLTGFLGSGKTSLLNGLLESRPETGPFSEASGKLALVVNEFGDVGIDGDLLPDSMTRQIELKGGCICCRLDEDLEKTLLELVHSQPDLSAIIIETTGIAEPLPISWTLAGERLNEEMRLAAVITVVDALEHATHRPLSPSVDAQVEYADVLVLSKLDLCGKDQVTVVTDLLRNLNQSAPLLAGSASENIESLWLALDDPESSLHRTSLSSGEPLEAAIPDKSAGHHFHSVALDITNILDFEILSEELESLGSNYVRIKGIARVVDGATGSQEVRLVAFHRVGARVSAEPCRPGLHTRMVAIGPTVDRDELSACLRAAVLK